ncbi:hypothetical protein BDA96_10G076400 [Sorghum bicolor]|uniref:Uncharacterized protein n=1 Tax=Sorghum bicolor TaxID=4558 RepID=A0A921U062_SORBI|nr:hypothetical protein BDA96_10G076400 [Sorghum bicolor]
MYPRNLTISAPHPPRPSHPHPAPHTGIWEPSSPSPASASAPPPLATSLARPTAARAHPEATFPIAEMAWHPDGGGRTTSRRRFSHPAAAVTISPLFAEAEELRRVLRGVGIVGEEMSAAVLGDRTQPSPMVALGSSTSSLMNSNTNSTRLPRSTAAPDLLDHFTSIIVTSFYSFGSFLIPCPLLQFMFFI